MRQFPRSAQVSFARKHRFRHHRRALSLLVALLATLPTTPVAAVIPTPTLVVGQPRLTLSASVSPASVLPGASFDLVFVAGTSSQEPRRIRVRLQNADWFIVADANTNSGTCAALDCTLAASNAARAIVRLRLIVRPGTPPGSLFVQASASDDLQNTAAAEPVRVAILASATSTPTVIPTTAPAPTAALPTRPSAPSAPAVRPPVPKSTARPRPPQPSPPGTPPAPTATRTAEATLRHDTPPRPTVAPPADDRGGSNPAPPAAHTAEALPRPNIPPAGPAPGDQP